MSDFDYEVGDVDDIGCQLIQNGNPIDLSQGSTSVVFNMATSDGVTKKQITCSLGGTVTINGVDHIYTSAQGGITMHVVAGTTTTAASYTGEWVVTISTFVAHIPGMGQTKTFKVWPAVPTS
jgi:hypothetical protein